MQAAIRLSNIARYASRSTLPNVVRPSTAMIRPFSTEGKEKNNKNWFTVVHNDLISPEKADLSYGEKLAIMKQAAPPNTPSNYIILRNLAHRTTLADIRRLFPNVEAIRDNTRARNLGFLKFATVEDAQNAMNIVNSATTYPFGPVTRLAPVYADCGDLSKMFNATNDTGILYLSEYHGTVEQLEALVAPFVPAGQELKVDCHSSKAWVHLGSGNTEAAKAVIDALHGQTYSAEHILQVRFFNPKAFSTQNETTAKE
ncbi:hypothetical protein FRC20_000673 [Serendipita sp. 405]|nr:hypothetical protein FRC20_000673 [Serendipita sp. 405]